MRILMANRMGFTPDQFSRLEELGFETVFLDGPETSSHDADFSDIDAVVCYRFFCYNKIENFTSLKYIHTTSAGLDHMPMDYIRAHGIKLCNARGAYSAPIAEFALCGVLQLYKGAELFRRQCGRHEWRQTRSLRELGGKQVCIVGAGSIAGETARRFSAMGCSVTGLCRHPAPTEFFDRVLGISELDRVLAGSDIVILALPLSDETYHLFDAGRFENMKDGSIFVNVARGGIVSTPDLLAALRDGRLSGAVLDVFEEEPLPADSPFWDMENVIVTPHNSFSGEHNDSRMFEIIYDDTKKWLEELEEKV